jgi:hypothetical protein
MTNPNSIAGFLEICKEVFSSELLVKLTLGKTRLKNTDLKNIFVRPVMLRQGMAFSVVYRFQTKDVTRNLSLDEALSEIELYLGKDFLQANLFGKTREVQLLITKKGKVKLSTGEPAEPLLQSFSHDRIKQRLINPEGNIYLQELGVSNKAFQVIPKMNDKFRQINKFVEIIESILPDANQNREFNIVDMGSGKGYLTFALYDHLVNNKKMNATISGVELRGELVDQCNKIARKAKFEKLQFITDNIHDFSLDKTNMLIALHACDTATDDAIFKGIRANADFIVVAPCCHKQVRKAMKPSEDMMPLLKHGVYLERQAELLTDGLRGLILEKHGYQTKALEFISTEHTPKNVMIIATKSTKKVDVQAVSDQIEKLKKSFGVDYHHLELLLGDSLL